MLKNITKTKHKSKQEWLEARALRLNSTEVSALFGLSPYMTEYELWHVKKNKSTNSFELPERAQWGNHLEAAIAKGLAKQFKWKNLKAINMYNECKEKRLGASFDYEFNDGDTTRLLEIKNVDGLVFKNDWVEDAGEFTAPSHIEIQAQHELLLSTKKNLTLGILVGGNRGIAIPREQNIKVQEMILEMSDRFWWSIDNDKPPKPDFNRDASFIIDSLKGTTEGKEIDLEQTPEASTLARAYLEAGVKERLAAKEKEGLKAQLLMLVGDAERAIHPEFSISAKLTPATTVQAFEKKPYRNFRITAKKETT